MSDIISDRLLAEFTATLGPYLWTPPAGEAPLGLHWCLSPPTAPTAELGPDGHPPRAHLVSTTDFPRRMWVGGALDLHAPLRSCQRVTRTTTLAPVEVKSGTTGQWCLSGADHRFEADGALLLTEHQDIAFRPAATGPAPALPQPPPLPQADARLDVPTPTTLLFRYSALTFNSHRIHYDAPYATAEEGYPGLVVHGPLQATILLNLAATLLGRSPTQFSYRATAPLIAGPPMTALARRDGDTIALSMHAADGRETMRGTAR
jgi:3-methylfumaryl-CoA hydratase